MMRKIAHPFLFVLITAWIMIGGLTIVPATHAAPATRPMNSDSRAPTIGDKQVKNVTLTTDGGYAILIGSNGYSTNNVAKTFNAKLTDLNTDGDTILSVAFTANGGWVIIYEDAKGMTGYWSEDIPADCETKLLELVKDKSTLISVSFTAENDWIILFDDYGYSSIGMQKDLVESLKKVNKDKKAMKQVSFAPMKDNPSVFLYGVNAFTYSDGLPQSAIDALTEYNEKSFELLSISFGENDSWVVVSDKEIVWDGVSKKLSDKIKQLVKDS